MSTMSLDSYNRVQLQDFIADWEQLRDSLKDASKQLVEKQEYYLTNFQKRLHASVAIGKSCDAGTESLAEQKEETMLSPSPEMTLPPEHQDPTLLELQPEQNLKVGANSEIQSWSHRASDDSRGSSPKSTRASTATGLFADSVENMRHDEKFVHGVIQKGKGGAALSSYSLSSIEATNSRLSGRLKHYTLRMRHLEEPGRDGWLATVVQSRRFEALCLIVIMINTMTTVHSTNFEMQHPGQSKSPLLQNFEMGFLCFYVFELFVRILTHRLYFFVNTDYKWNWLDLMLVVISLVNLVFAEMNLSFLRGLRVFKLAKILRALRMVRFVSELRLIMNAFVGCTMPFFWCFLMIFLIMGVFSMVLIQSLSGTDLENLDSADRIMVLDEFSSVQRGVLTLFGAAIGEWRETFQALRYTGSGNVTVYVCFLVFSQLALWNVTTSIFVEKAVKLAQPDLDSLMLEQHRDDTKLAQDLLKVCRDLIDHNGSGTISRDEFRDFMENLDVRGMFEMRGISIKDAEGFFTVLCSAAGGQEVPIDTFVAGCMRMKGVASSVDLQTLRYEVKIGNGNIKRLVRDVRDSVVKLDQLERKLTNEVKTSQSYSSSPPVKSSSLLYML